MFSDAVAESVLFHARFLFKSRHGRRIAAAAAGPSPKPRGFGHASSVLYIVAMPIGHNGFSTNRYLLIWRLGKQKAGPIKIPLLHQQPEEADIETLCADGLAEVR
jgi:hypothetical protein